MTIEPQWVAVVISLLALSLVLKRDTRNAKKADLDELRRERDECLARLGAVEGQMRVVREDNIGLMRKVLGMSERP